MILKQEINRIKKELVDINYRMLYGKTLTELIEEIILKYSWYIPNYILGAAVDALWGSIPQESGYK